MNTANALMVCSLQFHSSDPHVFLTWGADYTAPLFKPFSSTQANFLQRNTGLLRSCSRLRHQSHLWHPMLLPPQTTSKPVIEQFWISLDPECPGIFRKSLPHEPTASERMPSPFLSPIPVPAVSYRKPSQVASSKLGWTPLLYPLPTCLPHASH